MYNQHPDNIKKIKAIRFPIIMAPFYGVMIAVVLRELNQAQIHSCGNFSLIETFADKVTRLSKKTKPADINYEAKFFHRIVEESLVSPTYKELMEMYKNDNRLKETKKELNELKQKLAETPKGPQRTKLEEEIEYMLIWVDYVLPEDFLGTIVSFALGVDKSDIKKVSEEMLLKAAILAERGHDNPSDHLEGHWPEEQKGFYIDDINERAWSLLDELRAKNKQKKSKHGVEIG